MTQQQTPLLEKPVAATAEPMVPAPVPPPPPSPAKKKKKKKKALKVIVTLVILLAVLAGVGFLLWRFVFYQPDTRKILDDTVMRGSIQSTVEGQGYTKPKNAASLSPNSGGKVLELYVNEGDSVVTGQPLYRIDDTKAREAVTTAQKEVDNCQKELQAVYDKIGELTIKAPHAGKLLEISEIKVGDDVTEGAKIATLVNDTKLRLELYYNYTYENEISEGQTAQVSIPSIMGSVIGTVEKINYVRRIVAEGGVCFGVVLVLDNSGTLTDGMAASASLTAADGTPIYPYENGKLAYYEITHITAKAAGPVEQVNLLNYADVKKGDVLVKLGAKNTDEQIATKENALQAAQEKRDTAIKELEKYNAVATIDGKVLSCSLVPGAEIQSGQGISIADTSIMTAEIQLDQRNAGSVKVGMMFELKDWNDNSYMGTVTSVSLEAKNDQNSGQTYFPAVVSMDNPDGTIVSGQGIRYSFVANESSDCLMLPVACVRYVSDADGETATVVFLKTETPPENALTLGEEAMKEVPPGYYPVPVEVGLADNFNVEIISGINEGDLVFNSYTTDQGDSSSGGGMMLG